MVFDEITAKNRSAGGCDDHRDHEDCGSFRAFFRREGAKQHRSADGREDASTRALQHAKGDERLDVPGERAE